MAIFQMIVHENRLSIYDLKLLGNVQITSMEFIGLIYQDLLFSPIENPNLVVILFATAEITQYLES